MFAGYGIYHSVSACSCVSQLITATHNTSIGCNP